MKFLIYQSQLNQDYYFRFLNNTGRQLMQSNSYSSEQGVRNGIDNFKEATNEKSNFKIIDTDKGNLMFELKAKNNMTLGTSVVFESKKNLQEAMRYIIANASSASIEKQRPIP
ncbi:MAG: DUF1508 domain-containing protein [Bacteroidetes bacterium]|jgi:uncharacterized protein YegP (UPF0339 family)|nr:DUF1508 domain-containing protein [Bacteroidota bacterium]